MNHHPLFRAGIGLAITSLLLAQATGGRPGGGTGGGVTAPTTPTPTRTTTTPTQPTQTTQDPYGIERPIYLSGKVMMDDGTPPSEPVTIEMVCGGSRRSVGYTDSKGRFSIDLASRFNNGVMTDASQSSSGRMNDFGSISGTGSTNRSTAGTTGGANEMMLNGCDLQAALPGFRSDQARLTNRRSMDSPEIGTIVLHRLGNVEGSTISVTSALAPKDAKKALEKGRAEMQKGKIENAQREFSKAVEIYPKYAAAWFDLGQVQLKQKDVEGARKSYAQALAADPKFINPHQQLMMLAVREEKWEDVAASSSSVLKLNGVDFPMAWFYNAYANYRLHNMEAAEKSARGGVTADETRRPPKMNQLLGVILAEKKDFPGASENLKTYLRLAPNAPDASVVRNQLAELEKLMNPETAAKVPE